MSPRLCADDKPFAPFPKRLLGPPRYELMAYRTLGVSLLIRSARGRVQGLCVALSALLVSAAAQGGNDDEVLIGTEAILTGGAVTATVQDGSSLWYNPAGLGGVDRQKVDVTGTAYTFRLWVIPEYLEAPTGKTSSANTYEALTIPSAITFSSKLDNGWVIGMGYFLSRWSDIRGHSELSFDDEGEPAVWQSGYVQTYSLHNVALGTGLQLTPRVRLGAALIGFYNGVTFARELSGGITNSPESDFLTGTVHGLHSHAGLQLQAGVQWSPLDDLSFGISIKSAGLGIYNYYERQGYLSGSFDVTEVPGVPTDTPVPRPSVYQPDNAAQTDWSATWVLPPRFRLGVAHRLGRSYWSFDIDVQTAVKSKIVTLDDEDFQAANRSAVFNARLGGKLAINDLWAVGAGIFTDRSATSELALGEGSFDYYGGAFGVELGNVHRLASTEESKSIRFSTSMGVRYALGIGRVTATEVPHFNDLIAAFANGQGADFQETRVPAWAHELTFNLGGGLYF